MTNYRSLIPGGYFGDSTFQIDSSGKKVPPVSWRANNPGAVNGAGWERTFPGYVSEIKYDGKNNTTIFETPEMGVAAYWQLLRNYRDAGRKTVWDILLRYIGPEGVQDYFNDVHRISGMNKDDVVDIDNDAKLLPFAKAQFQHEGGKAIPWSDEQILYGFKFARAHAAGQASPPLPGGSTPPIVNVPPAPQAPTPPSKSLWMVLLELIGGLFKRKPSTIPPAPMPVPAIQVEFSKYGDKNPKVWGLQKRLVQLGLLLPDQVDGDFGERTRKAVQQFQLKRNLDPDGEVGELTAGELNRSDAGQTKPPSIPPPSDLVRPGWYEAAEKDIGFHETGENRGIEKFIIASKTGTVNELLGQPYCAIWVNAKLEDSGVTGSHSAMARSFENNPNFIRLPGPAFGAIVTNWRGSPSSGQGHVFFYDGENDTGVRGIGANEDDQIKRSFHPRNRITGYWWPKNVLLPSVGKIIVGAGGTVVRTET